GLRCERSVARGLQYAAGDLGRGDVGLGAAACEAQPQPLAQRESRGIDHDAAVTALGERIAAFEHGQRVEVRKRVGVSRERAGCETEACRCRADEAPAERLQALVLLRKARSGMDEPARREVESLRA